jgi:NAD(P) transhydrogenase
VLGGAQVNTGTIPSKALREAVLHLTGANRKGMFGQAYRIKQDISFSDLASLSQQVTRREWDIIRSQFDRNGVDLLWGRAKFVGPNHVEVDGPDGISTVEGDRFLVAVGTRLSPATNFCSSIGSPGQ